MVRYVLAVLSVLVGIIPSYSQTREDILKAALDSVGFAREDIGFDLKGYWNRAPLDIPYRLTSFDDLLAEPFKLYDYGKTMANAAQKYMEPAFIDTTSVSLYALTYSLGVDRKLGGFRSYSANLLPVTDSMQPLEKAIAKLFQASDQQSLIYTFGKKRSWPPWKNDVADLSGLLSEKTELILAKMVLNLSDIIHWRNLAFRNCDAGVMERAFNIRKLAMTQTDGEVYHPELDDIAATIDLPSLHYAALKAAALTEESADSLRRYGSVPDDLHFEISTPFGRIVLLGKNALDKNKIKIFDCDNTLLVIDFGNSGAFDGACGATASPSNPVSIFIDLDGNDTYQSYSELPAAGAGILGVGVFYDYAGDDTYTMKDYCQGFGLSGVGILMDRGGDDKYRAELSAQGCGYFGIGLCFDVSGKDEYYLFGDGQGCGGVGGGIGVLADYSGDDFYKGEPDPKIFNHADYHSDFKINLNNVQGVGVGRRGDGSDGHSWAGGLGAIIDFGGNDHYLSGNWSLGCSYWFATGIAYDGSGNDRYESCYFTQGSGAHFCNGILIDEGGNDDHSLYETAGAALGFGWDYTNAFLINIGGDDIYRAKMISLGLAMIRSNAFLFDIGGNDTYGLSADTHGLGEAVVRDGYSKPLELAPYYYYSKSVGCFIDIGGEDKYYSFSGDTEKSHRKAANNTFWLAPAENDSTYGAGNFGVGIDVESGYIPEIEAWQD